MPKIGEQIICAGSATSLACIFSNPLEVVKTRLQVQGEQAAGLAPGAAKPPRKYKNFLHTFRVMVREEGWLSLQRGLIPGMMYQFAMNGARLGGYAVLKDALYNYRYGSDRPKNDNALNILGGAMTGAAGGVAGSPMYMVKVRMQMQSSARDAVGLQHRFPYGTGVTGSLHTLYDIYQHGETASVATEGKKTLPEAARRASPLTKVGRLFHGVKGAIPRCAVGSASQLGSYELCKDQVLRRSHWEDGPLVHLASSMLSGGVVSVCMNPFDVVSSRLYNSSAASAKGTAGLMAYTGPIDCAGKMLRYEGPTAFFKGLTAHYLRVGPHTVMTFLFWEFFKKIGREYNWLSED